MLIFGAKFWLSLFHSLTRQQGAAAGIFRNILIASELSRLGRNLMEVMGILQKCLENECQVWTLKENYRLGADIRSKVLAFAFSLANEIERQLISDRTRESLKRVKAEGKHIGRPFGSTYRKLKRKHNKIKELLAKKVSKAEIARLLGCDWNTLHRYIKEQIASANGQEVPASNILSCTPI